MPFELIYHFSYQYISFSPHSRLLFPLQIPDGFPAGFQKISFKVMLFFIDVFHACEVAFRIAEEVHSLNVPFYP